MGRSRAPPAVTAITAAAAASAAALDAERRDTVGHICHRPVFAELRSVPLPHRLERRITLILGRLSGRLVTLGDSKNFLLCVRSQLLLLLPVSLRNGSFIDCGDRSGVGVIVVIVACELEAEVHTVIIIVRHRREVSVSVERREAGSRATTAENAASTLRGLWVQKG